jgi:hypothetical protein
MKKIWVAKVYHVVFSSVFRVVVSQLPIYGVGGSELFLFSKDNMGDFTYGLMACHSCFPVGGCNQ